MEGLHDHIWGSVAFERFKTSSVDIIYGHPDLWLLCSVFSMLFDIRYSLDFYTEVHFHVIYPPLLVDKHRHRNEC